MREGAESGASPLRHLIGLTFARLQQIFGAIISTICGLFARRIKREDEFKVARDICIIHAAALLLL